MFDKLVSLATKIKEIAGNRTFWLYALLVAGIALLSVAAYERIEEDRNRTSEGKHEFLSFTPGTFRQIYADDWHIGARKISGDIRFPAGEGPFPAVILYHGHYHPDDMGYLFNRIVPRLNEAGFATFVLDSFTGRKLTMTAFNHGGLSRAARLTDIYQALHLLARMDEIDENRIGITGYSAGGTAALLSIGKRLNETSLARGLSFAAVMPVYPSCQPRFGDGQWTGAPVFMLLGGADNYSPSEYCVELAGMMHSKGYDVRYKIYDDAPHGWVNRMVNTDCEDCMSLRDCGVTYIDAEGHEASESGLADTRFGWREYMDALYRECGSRGVRSLHSQKLSEETIKETIAFFTSTLK